MSTSNRGSAAGSVDEIRESRKDGYWGSPVDAYECLEAEADVDTLLGHIERLEREAAALQGEVNAGKALAMGIRNLITGWGSTSMELLLKQYQAAVSDEPQ